GAWQVAKPELIDQGEREHRIDGDQSQGVEEPRQVPWHAFPLTHSAMFRTSVICTRNSTSNTTRPAIQKPIAAPRCLSQVAPRPQANRRKGKLIMAQPPPDRLRAGFSHSRRASLGDSTLRRHRQGIESQGAMARKNGTPGPLLAKQEAPSRGGLKKNGSAGPLHPKSLAGGA